MTIPELNKLLGNVDIYLLDQLLKGRYPAGTRVLDAGCGEGRNIVYFLNQGYSVHGVDINTDAIRMLHFILGTTYPDCPKSNFVESPVEDMPFPDGTFDLVISSAVLHFAQNHNHFRAMFAEMVRVMAPQGQLFVRMTSSIGLEGMKPQGDSGRYSLPDGSERYLIDRRRVNQLLEEFDLQKVEPVKTTNVDDMRCMTTLVLRKN